MTIRTVIVDDERLARRKMRSLVARDPDMEVVGESASGSAALEMVAAVKPDLLFLDIQMPEMDGFELLAALPPEAQPFVVFVTAYDQYALKAFEFSAVDYVLKPVDRTRFVKTLNRIKERIRTRSYGELQERLPRILQHSGRPAVERIPVKAGGRVMLIRTQDVDWIEAEGKYVRLHVARQQYLVRETMALMELRLDSSRFLRIHRSFIVNIEKVKELEPWFHNEYRIVLADGTRLPLGRGFKKNLSAALGNLI